MSSTASSKNTAGSERLLRVGVVGAGVMGTNHARVLAGLPGVELVGIVDPLAAHRTRASQMLGCPTFTTLEEMLDAGLDAVTIAAPTHLHRDVSLACIARKIHILVEKPIASSVEEGHEIVDAARAAGNSRSDVRHGDFFVSKRRFISLHCVRRSCGSRRC